MCSHKELLNQLCDRYFMGGPRASNAKSIVHWILQHPDVVFEEKKFHLHGKKHPALPNVDVIQYLCYALADPSSEKPNSEYDAVTRKLVDNGTPQKFFTVGVVASKKPKRQAEIKKTGTVTMAAELALDRDLHHFSVKWGDTNRPAVERASKLLHVLYETQAAKVKRMWTIPDQFGFEVEPGKPIIWTNARIFVEAVVDSYQGPTVRYLNPFYKVVVGYLIEEGHVSCSWIKKGYYDVSKQTASLLCEAGMNAELKKARKELALEKAALDAKIKEWMQAVEVGIYQELERGVVGESIQLLMDNPGLECDAVYEFFNAGDVKSMKAVAVGIHPLRDAALVARKSTFGELIQKTLNGSLSVD